MIRVQEDRVSYTVGKDDETRYWDGGVEHREVVGEGSYNQEQEEQEWMASTDYEGDDHDLQIALAMSERTLGWTKSSPSVSVTSIQFL